jgi:hypothetical protein
VRQLGGGAGLGLATGLAAARLPVLGAIGLSASTFGAGWWWVRASAFPR